VLLVIGSKREYDNNVNKMFWKEVEADSDNAKELLKGMDKSNVTNNNIRMDRKLTPGDKKDHHLILIGGPTVNALTRDIDLKLPLQYVQIVGEDKFYSRISGNLYQGSDDYSLVQANDYSLVQAFKSPFSDDKIIICIFGLDRFGTRTARIFKYDMGCFILTTSGIHEL
jgi:S-layer like family, C-terminal region